MVTSSCYNCHEHQHACTCTAKDYYFVVIAQNIIFSYIQTNAQEGKVALAAFTQLTPDLYSMDCIDKNGNNALHIAGLNGFTALAKQILDDQGYSRLLWAKNLKCHYPVQVSLNEGKFDTAAVYLRSMNDW